MKRQMMSLGWIAAGLFLVAGCASEPPEDASGKPAAAPAAPLPHVENGATMFFDEVMVAVPVEGAHQVYQNLHVGVAVSVTPRGVGGYNTNQVAWLFRRLEPRVDAAVLQVATDAGTVSPRKVGALRDAIAGRVQEVASQTVGNWEHTHSYDVELSVVSLYFTDSTVGRGGNRRDEAF